MNSGESSGGYEWSYPEDNFAFVVVRANTITNIKYSTTP